MKWLCKVIGHGCRTVQFEEICSWVGPDHWCWPGVISYCPRCGFLFRSMGNKGQIRGPWFVKTLEAP